LEVFHYSKATGRWYGKSKGNAVSEATHQDLVNEHKDHLHVAMSSAQVSGTQTSNPLLSALSPAAGLLSGPFDAAATLTDVMRPIGVVAVNLASPVFWRRVGMGMVGSALIVTGIVFINREKIRAVGGALGSVIGSTAGTAVQGAAFGFGATKGGGGAALGGAAPPKGPYPPKRAINPPSNAPTTAVLPEAYAPVSAGGTYTVTAVGRAKRPASPLPDTMRKQPKKSKKGGTENLFTPSFTMRDTKK
jgi:hypothetical protein